MANNSHGRRRWPMFINCILLATAVGWLVDSSNAPHPLWESQGSYANIESALIHSQPWLVTVSPHEKQLKVWDLSRSKNGPVRSTQLMSADGRMHGFGNELIDYEFYFLEQHELKPGITQLKKWNILTGELSTVCSRSCSSERSQVLLSFDGRRMFSSEEMPIGHLSLLSLPSLGNVVSAGFVDWSNKKDKTCFLHPHRVEVIDCRNGETISQFLVPAFHGLITRSQLSTDGKWLASVAKLPSFWCQAKKNLHFATSQREIVIYNTMQGSIASKVPFSKQFPFPIEWVGDYLYIGKATQVGYQGEGICYFSDGISEPPVLVEPLGGETLHVFNKEALLSSYCTKEKLIFNTTSNVVEVEIRAGLSQKDAFEVRKVYDHSHLNPANYHMQLVHGTTQLAMSRHALANSRWPRIMSFLYRYNLSDWGRFLPEYHSIEVYDYVTGQQRELARSMSINQDISILTTPSNLVDIIRHFDNHMEYQLWSSEMPNWNIGYSIITALLLLLMLLRWTNKRRVQQMHG